MSNSDYHGYACRSFTVGGCDAKLVEPKTAAPGRPWIWRAMFWDAFPGVDLALLARGFHLAYIEVGDTFGAPDAIRHWEPFYDLLTTTYGLSRYPALEGLSRGGLYIYRWAASHPDKVGCVYGDAPACDIKIMLRGAPDQPPSESLAKLMDAYHFASTADMQAYDGNPIDDSTLKPLAAAHVPIIHVVGSEDAAAVSAKNTDILRERYLALGGSFFEIVKQGCPHHPHGLADPTVVADFLAANASRPQASNSANRFGEILTLAEGEW